MHSCTLCKHYTNPMRWLGAFLMGMCMPLQAAQSQRYSVYRKISSSLAEESLLYFLFNQLATSIALPEIIFLKKSEEEIEGIRNVSVAERANVV